MIHLFVTLPFPELLAAADLFTVSTVLPLIEFYIHNWNHTSCSLFKGFFFFFSHSHMHMFPSCLCGLVALFVFIIQYSLHTVCLSIYLLRDNLTASSF